MVFFLSLSISVTHIKTFTFTASAYTHVHSQQIFHDAEPICGFVNVILNANSASKPLRECLSLVLQNFSMTATNKPHTQLLLKGCVLFHHLFFLYYGQQLLLW